MRTLLSVLLALVVGGARAAPALEICFNYGCAAHATVRLDDARLVPVRAVLAAAPDAAAERAAIARAIGMLYRIAGEQTPIAADRAGNYLDGGVDGRMDCIDHSTTTTRLLRQIEAGGALRFHRVIEPERRARFIFAHFSAVIEEVAPSPRPPPAPVVVPDHVAPLLALCDCADVSDDIERPDQPEPTPPGSPGARFAVDSWFVDHGEPAVVLPLAEWLNGEGPNVQ